MLNNKRKYFLYTHLFLKFFLREMHVFLKWKFILLLFIKFDLLKW